MQLFLSQFATVLDQAIADPKLALFSFSLITPQCRGLLPDPTCELHEPVYPPVTRLFRDWAERTPGHIAVSQSERQWTYKQVRRLSDGLARELQACGVQAGDVVALHGPRSLGTIVGMLAVLSSRGVLLLVDGDLPVKRKELLLVEAAPKAVIGVGSNPWLETWRRGKPAVMRYDLDPQTGALADEQRHELAGGVLVEPRCNDAAYFFFTSGTTRIPKGIVGCHKGLSQFLIWQRTEFAIGTDDCVAQLHRSPSMSF